MFLSVGDTNWSLWTTSAKGPLVLNKRHCTITKKDPYYSKLRCNLKITYLSKGGPLCPGWKSLKIN